MNSLALSLSAVCMILVYPSLLIIRYSEIPCSCIKLLDRYGFTHFYYGSFCCSAHIDFHTDMSCHLLPRVQQASPSSVLLKLRLADLLHVVCVCTLSSVLSGALQWERSVPQRPLHVSQRLERIRM